MQPRFAEVTEVVVGEKHRMTEKEERRSATVRLNGGTIDIYPGADTETIHTLINLLRHAE